MDNIFQSKDGLYLSLDSWNMTSKIKKQMLQSPEGISFIQRTDAAKELIQGLTVA